jgi:hypothetical protein
MSVGNGLELWITALFLFDFLGYFSAGNGPAENLRQKISVDS